MRPPVRAVAALALAAVLGVASAAADEPFYKGKRLTILVNFAAGGPTDIEARMFAKHLVRHVDGAPNIIIQNMDGAGGVVGAKYMGEVAPRDGTMAGYFTGTAFIYALDPERFRVDFKTYEFVATQAGTTVHFVRTDVEPGMKEATDIVKAKGLIGGGLSVDTSKDLRMRLAFDMLGIPYKYVTGYRSSPAARLALQRGEINFFSESPPSYRGVIEPSMVKTGQVIPVFYDPSYDGVNFGVPHPVKGLAILPLHELYQKIKGTMPSGRLWDIYKSLISTDGIIQRMIVMPPGAPKAAVEAIRAAIPRLNADQALRRGGREGVRLRAAMGGLARHQQGRAGRADGAARGAHVPHRLHEELAAEVGWAKSPAEASPHARGAGRFCPREASQSYGGHGARRCLRGARVGCAFAHPTVAAARLASKQSRNPALHPLLVLLVLRPEPRPQASFVAEHAAMKPDRMHREQCEREPRPERHRQPEHEDEMPKIHRVARIGVDTVGHQPLRRHREPRSTAAVLHAVMSGEPVLQIAPGQQQRPPWHEDQIAAADGELERDHGERIEQEGAGRGAGEQAAERP